MLTAAVEIPATGGGIPAYGAPAPTDPVCVWTGVTFNVHYPAPFNGYVQTAGDNPPAVGDILVDSGNKVWQLIDNVSQVSGNQFIADIQYMEPSALIGTNTNLITPQQATGANQGVICTPGNASGQVYPWFDPSVVSLSAYRKAMSWSTRFPAETVAAASSWFALVPTYQDTDTIRVPHDDQTEAKVDVALGMPIRYMGAGGIWLYGVITNITDNTTTYDLTVAGVEVPTSIIAVEIGSAKNVNQMELFIAGDLSASTTAIQSLVKTLLSHRQAEAYMVRAEALVNTASSSGNLTLNLTVDGSDVFTADLNLTTTTGPVDSGVTVDSATYKAEYGDDIEVDITNAGTDSADLTVIVTYVIP